MGGGDRLANKKSKSNLISDDESRETVDRSTQVGLTDGSNMMSVEILLAASMGRDTAFLKVR